MGYGVHSITAGPSCVQNVSWLAAGTCCERTCERSDMCVCTVSCEDEMWIFLEPVSRACPVRLDLWWCDGVPPVPAAFFFSNVRDEAEGPERIDVTSQISGIWFVTFDNSLFTYHTGHRCTGHGPSTGTAVGARRRPREGRGPRPDTGRPPHEPPDSSDTIAQQ